MKKLLALVATASLMFSCSQDEATPSFEKLPINISMGVQTRANDTTYENGDEVGIYVVNYDGSTAGTLAASGNQVDNMRFTFNNGSWTPNETIYWKDQNTAADFYAYYPYSASANITAHPFSVKVNQSDEADFWVSDFLWGKSTKISPTSLAVPIITNHSFSRILLAVEPGYGFTEESWDAATKSVKICNVKTNATINLASGVATATGDDGEIVPFFVNPTYKAMMVPQTIAANSKLIVVTVDGVDYVYCHRENFTFKANTQHRFVVTVNKSGSNVDVTIGEWDMDGTVNIGNAEADEFETTIPNNQIWYTSTDGNIVNPKTTDVFGANIGSNNYTDGKGVIIFDGDVTEIEYEAFKNCTSLESIIIPGCVTVIGYGAFMHCTSLASVTLPNSVETIENLAFYDCTSLTSIIIPENVKKIEYESIVDCTSLESVYCKPTTPPAAGSKMFDNAASNLKIYVPIGSATEYKTANYWDEYASIIEEKEM